MSGTTLLRRETVLARTGLRRSTFAELVKRGTFPQPIRLTPKTIGWLESEVEDWIAARVKASRPNNTED